MKDLVITEEVSEAYAMASLLREFKCLCDLMNNNADIRGKALSMMRKANNDLSATKSIFKKYCSVELDDPIATEMSKLLKAYFTKLPNRKHIPEELKKELLVEQDKKCAICNKKITLTTMHVDHIIPFKYVGDELEGNYQALCDICNEKKGASTDFYFRSLIGLV